MPTYSVTLHVRGPLRNGETSVPVRGAYAEWLVVADCPEAASTIAVEDLKSDPEFQNLQLARDASAPQVQAVKISRQCLVVGSAKIGGYIFSPVSDDE